MSVGPQEYAGTSALGSLGARGAAVVAILSLPGTALGTSSNSEWHMLAEEVELDEVSTSAGGTMLGNDLDRCPDDQPADDAVGIDSTRDGLHELRRRSGLTWAQVGRLFGVSRRSVHFWASGKSMSSDNEEHLHHVLALVRKPGASADAIRGALLSLVAGRQVLELLAARQYDDAEPVLRAVDGQGVPPTTHRRPPLSEAASAERRPLPPEVLASGEERLHHEVKGRGRPARTARSRNRGQS